MCYASPCDSPLISGQLTFLATVFQICFNSFASLPTHILALSQDTVPLQKRAKIAITRKKIHNSVKIRFYLNGF